MTLRKPFRAANVRSQDEMYSLIVEAVRETHNRYQVEVKDRMPKLSTLHEPVILGSFSWTLPQSRQRWLAAGTAIYLNGWLPCTPTDLVRAYLDIKYPKPLRCRSSQYQNFHTVRRSHPLFAKRCHLAEAAYVDLKSAYWTLTRVLGWNVEYHPSRFLASGQSMEDWPFPDFKLARNCLVSAGLGGKMRIYAHGDFTLVKVGNKHKNLGLWSAIQDILNSIALEMILLGAVYVHTDGYIVPMDRLTAAFDCLASWGLPAAIKHMGATNVYGAGAYDCGSHVYRPKIITQKGGMQSIRPVEDVAWLRSMVKFHADRTLSDDDYPSANSAESIARFLAESVRE